MDSLAWISSSEIRRLASLAVQQGWRVGRTRKGHVVFRPQVGTPVTTSGTPSDWRVLANTRAALVRSGFNLDVEREKRWTQSEQVEDLEVGERPELPTPVWRAMLARLDDEPVTSSLLATQLRLDGFPVTVRELERGLRGLCSRGQVEERSGGYVRVERPFSFTPLPEIEPDAVVSIRGVWHYTDGEYTDCGYRIPDGAVRECREPTCNDCLTR